MKHRGKKNMSLLLTLVLVLSLVPAFSMTALADGDTTYTLTIPSTLTVANSGWNATDGISATGTLASGKKMTVTATSANSWSLKSGNNSVGYTLTTAEGGSQTTSWEFTELSSTATKKDMGIIVADYSTKPAGTYQDTVTFTAKVEDTSSTITIGGVTLNYSSGDTWREIANKNSDKIDANDRVGGGVIRYNGGWLCKDVADSNHLVRPNDIIDPKGNYMWW